MKRIKEKISSIHKQIQFRRQLRTMDHIWDFYGGCFGLHRPSFYYKHSEEEAERIQKEEIAKLKEILNDFQARHSALSGTDNA